MITKADIEKLAQLSRLKLTEAEKEKYLKDMESILAYVKQINEAPVAKEDAAEKNDTGSLVRFAKTTRSPASFFSAAPRNVMRADDHPHESGVFTDALIALAPRSKGKRVKVKKIL